MPFSEIAAAGIPRPDQIEVCVFGPGFGECILLHLGDGKWVVVDSCVHGPAKDPVALLYLRALGLNPSRSIRLILATHWHDDHCRGLSKVVQAAPDAPIWISHSLTTRDFLKFAARMRRNTTTLAGTKLTEFTSVMDEIRRRHDAGLTNFGFAAFRSALCEIPAAVASSGLEVALQAISPSHGDHLEFLTWIASKMPAAKQTKCSVPSPDRNLTSVASLLRIGASAVLLGADLLNSPRDTSGWRAVLQSHSQAPIGPTASLYKIAHHGSSTGHHPDIWKSLLVSSPTAVLTPWQRGGREVPSPAEIDTLKNLTPSAFATSFESRSRLSLSALPSKLRSQMRIRRVPMRSLNAPFGAVRFRSSNSSSGGWECALFGAACHIRQIPNLRRKKRRRAS
jgi:Metallo-beta-lactamase superfamily